LIRFYHNEKKDKMQDEAMKNADSGNFMQGLQQIVKNETFLAKIQQIAEIFLRKVIFLLQI